MEPNLVAQAAAGGTAVDFSFIALFLRADIVVKIVMLGLLTASVWCWAIIIDKWGRLGRARKRCDQFEETFWSGKSLDDLYSSESRRPSSPMGVIFCAAMREWQRTFDRGGIGAGAVDGVRARIDKVMSVTLQRELGTLESNIPFLATVGSTAPFIGLFGTVWGIMNSFRAIATSHDTNLAVVAPGIAEALFATALGLLAAIPAVVFYNKFSNELGRLAGKLEGFADEFSAILSRQLDDRVS